MKTIQIKNRATMAINELAEAVQEASKEGLVVDPMKTFVNSNPGFMSIVITMVDPNSLKKPEPEEVVKVVEQIEPEPTEEVEVKEEAEEEKEVKPVKKKAGRPKKQK